MKKLKYGDIIIFVCIIILSFFYAKQLIQNKNNKIIIYSPKKSLRYDLDINREIDIDGILGNSKIIISNHQVMFILSPCKDKLCIKTGILKNSPLICMPNGVIIRFEKNNYINNIEIDSVVQ